MESRNILIIGASRGLGLELARQYLADGHRVIATARDDEGLARLQALGAQTLRVDVADPASVSSLSWQLDGERIDIALYVAGVFAEGDALSPPTQQLFDRTLHTNVLGAMQVIPQVAPLVEASRLPGGGRFGFISSDMAHAGSVSASRGWTYRVSKAALNMAVAAAQCDYPRAILVALSPGWVRTDMGGASAPLSAAESAKALRQTLDGLGEAQRGAFLRLDCQPFDGA